MTDLYPVLGIAATLLTWLIIWLILRNSQIDVKNSVSQHAALQTKRQKLYAVSMTITLLLLTVYVLRWFIPEYELSNLFKIVFLLGIILQITASWLPDTKHGTTSKVHEFCAYGSAALMPLLVALLVGSSSIQGLKGVFCLLILVTMVVFIFLYQFVKKSHEQYLWFQITYIVLFQLSLVLPAIEQLV